MKARDAQAISTEIAATDLATRSRESAVLKVYRGGLILLGGAAATVASVVFGNDLPAFLGAVASLTVFGAGGVVVGLASTHLFRCGRVRSWLPLIGVAGLGASTAVNAVSALMLWLGIGSVAVLNQVSGFGMFGFAVFLLIQALGFIVRWTRSRVQESVLLA